MDGACWVCFCCQHSPISGMNVRIFRVYVMECMCAQSRPWSILSSKEFLENGVRTHANSKGQIPSTRKILLRGGSNPQHCSRTARPTHYQQAILVPWLVTVYHHHGHVKLFTYHLSGLVALTAAHLDWDPTFCRYLILGQVTLVTLKLVIQ